MSESNALTSRGSVLEAIANPKVENPETALSTAATAAQTIYGVQEKQAQQAVGNILQQATDENGNVNYETAQRLAAQAGPVVQMGMSTFLKDASGLRGQQLTQGISRNTAANNAIIGALNGDDAGLHDRVVAGLQGLVTSGVYTQDEATRSALRLPTDPAQLRQRLAQIQTSLAPAELQQQQISGTPFRQTGPGGTTIGGTQDIRTGAVSGQPGQQGLPQGLDPSQTAAYQQWLKTGRDYPDPANPTVMKHGTNETFLKDSGVPDQYVYPGGAPATPGTQPGAASPLGTGRLPPALQNPNKPPATPAPAPVATPAPAPTPVAPAPAPFGGYTIGGGGAPAAPAAPAPSPAAPASAPSPAGSGISGPTPAQKAAAAGTEKATELDIAAYKADQAAQPDVQTSAQNLAHAYTAMSALKSATGKGAAGINDLRSFAQTLGILPKEAVNEQRLFELVRKYTEREMINAAGGSTTDMGRRMQEQANAGTLLSESANVDIMRNDMGKRLQTIAANKDHDPQSGGAGYLANRAKVADSTDPRGFVWDLYSPEEQAAINAEVAKNPTAADKLHKAMGMADRLKLHVTGLPAR
jgi:hypothetical protein